MIQYKRVFMPYKTGPMGLVLFAWAMCLCMIMGCASQGLNKEESLSKSKKQASLSFELRNESCPVGHFMGNGISENYDEALDLAISQIASQIESSVKVNNTLHKRQELNDGKEYLSSTYKVKTKVESHLRNRQDVFVQSEIWQGDSVGIVACLSKKNAAKPYRQDLKKSVLKFESSKKIFEDANHPLEKKRAFEKIEDSYKTYNTAVSVLNSLGIYENGADSEIEESYNSLRKEYNDFVSNWHFYFVTNNESDEENAVLEELGRHFHLIVADECNAGLKLSVEISDATCKEGALGISCVRTATLNGESCSGEKYFNLGASLKGIGKLDEEDALRRLVVGIKKNNPLKNWIEEIKKWEVK